MARSPSKFRRLVAPAAAVVALAACGSGSSVVTPSKPLLDPSQARTEPIVTITAAGVDPVDSHLDRPVIVKFVNRDSVRHQMDSAPEIGNGDCPEMAQVGLLEPGQTGMVTIDKAGYICSFHDGLQPSNVRFKGILVVH